MKRFYLLFIAFVGFQVGLKAQSQSLKGKTLPSFLRQKQSVRSLSEYDSAYNPYQANAYIGVANYLPNSYKKKFSQEKTQPDCAKNSSGFEKKGYLNRSFSMGSTQQMGSNSNLDLQFKGELSPNFFLEGNLTDRRLPFQAEGNTTTLRELDQIYIKGYGSFGTLEAGDKIISAPTQSKYLAYNRRIQGIRYSHQTEKLSVYAGTAVSRGKFASVTLVPSEGVLGPYRIVGPDGEWAVIVLANSEKVYLDGILLQRGTPNGYTIDYNLGEISFAQGITITRFSRIRVEYQAFTQSYRRTITEAGALWKLSKNFQLGFNHFTEADDPNKPFLFIPNKGIEEAMAYAGNQALEGWVSSIKPAQGFRPNEILYKKTVSLYGDTLLEWVNTPTSETLFTASFLAVPLGKGDYEPVQTLAQGKVFRYVGKGLGTFMPIQKIATPSKKSLSTLSAHWAITKGQNLVAEAAFQNNSFNRYAPGDLKSEALYLSHEWKQKINGKIDMETQVGHRHSGAGFTGIDRYRALEWSRMWSLPMQDSAKPQPENNQWAKLSITQNKGGFVNFEAERVNRQNTVNGFRYQTDFSQPIGKFLTSGRWGQNSHQLMNRQVFRQDEWLELKMPIQKGWQTALVWQSEKNSLSAKNSDSLWAGALWFQQQSLLVSKTDSLNLPVEIRLTRRQDAGIKEGKRDIEWEAYQIDGKTQLVNKELQAVWNYRSNKNLFQPLAPVENNLSFGLDWSRRRKDEFLNLTLTYQAATGRELKRDYRFVLSPVPGMGTHKWIDFNNDGLQQIDEFVEAILPEEKQYIKLLAPTNEMVPAYQSKLVYSGVVASPQNRAPTSLINWLFKKVHWHILMEADRKTMDNDWQNRMNPFAIDADRALALSNRQAFSNKLLINPNNTRWNGQLRKGRRTQRFVQSQGFDSRTVDDWHMEANFSPNSDWEFSAAKSNTHNAVESNYLQARNYEFGTSEWSFETRWQLGTKTLYSINYKRGKKNPSGAEANTMKFQKLSLEARYSLNTNTRISSRLQCFDFAYQGEMRSALAYELLEAWSVGRNYQWQCEIDHTTPTGMKIGFRYEGRQMPSRPLIHYGSLNVGMAF